MIRSCVEHVFTDQKSQTGLFIRTVGMVRATMRIGLDNIVYNLRRTKLYCLNISYENLYSEVLFIVSVRIVPASTK